MYQPERVRRGRFLAVFRNWIAFWKPVPRGWLRTDTAKRLTSNFAKNPDKWMAPTRVKFPIAPSNAGGLSLELLAAEIIFWKFNMSSAFLMKMPLRRLASPKIKWLS